MFRSAHSGIRMHTTAPKWIAALLLWSGSVNCHGTDHVFVRNNEGVWLVSDSLWSHNDGSQISRTHKCKVVISRGRLIFNQGHFKDLSLLMSQESALPFADIDTTEKSLWGLMATNHMDKHGDPRYTPDLAVVVTGIVQVEKSVFSAKIIGQPDNLKGAEWIVKKWIMGVPHGLSSASKQSHDVATKNSAVAARIANNPKAELLKIITDESVSDPDEIGGPFTVLLLRNDGTVSDFSDNSLCSIPANAAHLKTRTHRTHAKNSRTGRVIGHMGQP